MKNLNGYELMFIKCIVCPFLMQKTKLRNHSAICRIKQAKSFLTFKEKAMNSWISFKTQSTAKKILKIKHKTNKKIKKKSA